jgi:hypothetical protein
MTGSLGERAVVTARKPGGMVPRTRITVVARVNVRDFRAIKFGFR